MTPEQRTACRNIEREGYKLNGEVNELRADQSRLRELRATAISVINTNKREITRLQRDRLTACLPGTRSSKRHRSDDFFEGIEVYGCIQKITRIDRQISKLQAGLRELQDRLLTYDRDLETLRRRIAGKEALFLILRQQKQQHGCP